MSNWPSLQRWRSSCVKKGGHENPEHYASSRFLTMPAPVAYKILQCEKDYVHFQHDRHDLDGFTYIDYV